MRSKSAGATPAFIGIGSNLGDRLALCREAIRRLGSEQAARIVKTSSLYETEPVGYLQQDRFYNAVVEIETSLAPYPLLERCQKIEEALGKKISIPKGPRTIDLDLLFYGQSVIDAPGLTLPHPALSDRAFVLIPLAEIAPHWIHPLLRLSAVELLKRIGTPSGIERIAEPGWERIPLASNGR